MKAAIEEAKKIRDPVYSMGFENTMCTESLAVLRRYALCKQVHRQISVINVGRSLPTKNSESKRIADVFVRAPSTAQAVKNRGSRVTQHATWRQLRKHPAAMLIVAILRSSDVTVVCSP